jgi:hypothetical protein
MKSEFANRFAVAFFLLSVFTCIAPLQAAPQNLPDRPVAADATISPVALLQPQDLVSLLKSSAKKPLILQVGSRVMFAQAHIPGSEYVGAAGMPTGLEALRKRVAALNKSEAIILYCGCCPWGKCPNIRPAFRELESLGFTNLKVLYLPENFGADWVDKGFPVEGNR